MKRREIVSKMAAFMVAGAVGHKDFPKLAEKTSKYIVLSEISFAVLPLSAAMHSFLSHKDSCLKSAGVSLDDIFFAMGEMFIEKTTIKRSGKVEFPDICLLEEMLCRACNTNFTFDYDSGLFASWELFREYVRLRYGKEVLRRIDANRDLDFKGKEATDVMIFRGGAYRDPFHDVRDNLVNPEKEYPRAFAKWLKAGGANV
ncbi:hypothetical protein MA12_gp18 [Pectobacterium phage MA12]|uniref:Uncharacterized protein n=1 Tax=Pectobacterium phage MA12 TaxID=2686474 RepID=A0A6B9RQ00_9CAUD|nr:hypothetical protein JT357_gp18 [Pectobacterium phage MA12]QHI00845.1 hypothetical protein MA12_gp18 [Pectobacterium phage MA12]